MPSFYIQRNTNFERLYAIFMLTQATSSTRIYCDQKRNKTKKNTQEF